MLNPNLFNTARYTVIRKDRKVQNAPGGGVAILIRNNLCVDENSTSSLVDHEAQESVWCEVRIKEKKNIIIGTVYRPPSSAAENNDLICDLIRLSENHAKDKQILVCGDFNFGNILWEENRVEEGSQGHGQAAKFLDSVNDNFWTQNVTDWTHLRETDNPSRLDLIFTKTTCEVEEIRYLAPLGLSKHAVLCFSLVIDSTPEEQSTDTWKLNYHKADTEKMRDLFTQEDWKTLFHGKSTNEKWETLKEKYNRTVAKCVPTYKRKQGSAQPKWMNRQLQALIRKKQEAWKRYRTRNSAAHRERYNSARNLVTREVRTAKYNYEKKVAQDATYNAKHFWAYVRSKTTAKETISRLRAPNGEVTENDEETAHEMNQAFNRVFVREDDSQPTPTTEHQFQGPKLLNINVTKEDVRGRLKTLNGSKASGTDGVSPQILKDCCDELCEPLCDIFQTSLEIGEVPDDWRKADISPIFKKGSKMDPLNYRPVSLISVVSKVLEGIIRKEIVRHLT